MTNNTAIIFFLLSVGLFYTFTNPQYQDVKKLQTLAGEYRNVLKSVSEIVELRDRLTAEYQTIPEREIDRMNKALPNDIDNVRLALDLDTMASRYGIAIKSIQASTADDDNTGLIVLPEDAKPYEKATITFSFIASYDNYSQFIKEVERSLRLMDIRTVSFQVGTSNLYEYYVGATTYWLK